MSLAAIRRSARLGLTRYPKAYDALRMPYSVVRFWLRQPHDSDYRVFSLFPNRRGEFLDVGANAGMSALSFRVYNKSNPIVSIEPNRFHERDLRFVKRLAKPMDYYPWAAGSEAGVLHLSVPVYRGVPLTAYGSLLESDIPSSTSLKARLGPRLESPQYETVHVEVPVRPLDTLNLSPAFIKLDVQGFEHEALLGLMDTLKRSHPILLIEAPDEATRELLGDLGYDAFSYDTAENRLIPEIRKRPNTVFVHDMPGTSSAQAPSREYLAGKSA